MHSFILINDDIYTLDTAAERTHAAEHMRDAGVDSRPVYRGSPTRPEGAEGRDFCSDGSFSYDGNTGD